MLARFSVKVAVCTQVFFFIFVITNVKRTPDCSCAINYDDNLRVTPQPPKSREVINRDEAANVMFEPSQRPNKDKAALNGQCFAGDRSFILLVTINYDFLPLMYNWAESLNQLDVRCGGAIVVEDDDAIHYLRRHPVPLFKILNKEVVGNHSHTEYYKQFKGPYSYLNLINRRLSYILTLLKNDNDVLLVDVDAVWLKNPLPFIEDSYSQFDVWLAKGTHGMPCPCFMFVKSNQRTIDLIQRWSKRLISARKKLTDQQALRLVLRETVSVHLKVLMLPLTQFPTGKEFFNPLWHDVNKETVYVAHANHLGRQENKIKMLKEFKLWFIPD